MESLASFFSPWGAPSLRIWCGDRRCMMEWDLALGLLKQVCGSSALERTTILPNDFWYCQVHKGLWFSLIES